MTEILKSSKAKSNTEVMGINYELFTSENVDAKGCLLKDKVLKGLDSASIKLAYTISDTCQLILEVADAIYDDVDGVVFRVNFNNTLKSGNIIYTLLDKKDWVAIAKAKIEELLA